MEALSYYDTEIAATENLNPSIVGIDALERKTKDFIDHAEIEAIEVVSLLSEDNLSVTNWYYAYNHKINGKFSGHVFSVQRWRNNKIIQKNHFYSD